MGRCVDVATKQTMGMLPGPRCGAMTKINHRLCGAENITCVERRPKRDTTQVRSTLLWLGNRLDCYEPQPGTMECLSATKASGIATGQNETQHKQEAHHCGRVTGARSFPATIATMDCLPTTSRVARVYDGGRDDAAIEVDTNWLAGTVYELRTNARK
jgi:hypothetical protein